MPIKKIAVWIFVWVIIGVTTSIKAENLARDTSDSEYVIGPGDMIKIQVWGQPDLTHTLEVSREGAFTFPLIGRVTADGLTMFDLEKQITRRLADGYLVSPQVTVSVSEYKHRKVYFFGEVKKPGIYIVKGRTHLLELASEIGGLTNNAGTKATIVRPRKVRQNKGPLTIENARENEIIAVDLEQLKAGADSESFYVIPGDSVYVHEAEPIFVTGEVKKPGQYNWEKNMSVREAISLAGGPSKVGAPQRTRIIRIKNGIEKVIEPNLYDQVMPEDIIKVPKSYF